MERNHDCLFALKYQDLIHRIVNGVREKAQEIPAFRESGNGCIRITIVPLSELAEAWLGGGLSDFGNFPEVNVTDVCEREFVYPIRPGGNHTIQWKDPEDGHVEPVNCYAYSAMKTAFASWRRKFLSAWARENPTLLDDMEAKYRAQLQYRTEDNGWSTHEGSVHTTVTLDGEEFLRIYVCTSGAESWQDEQCSLRGMLQAKEYFCGATEVVQRSYFPDGVCNAVLNFQLVPDFVNVLET